MAPVIPLRPMADGMLIHFFLNTGPTLTGKRLDRVERAHADLLACIADHLAEVDPGAAARAQTSDRPHRQDAAAASVAPRAVLDFLPFFLDEPRWHGSDLRDRVVRADLAWQLAQWIDRRLGVRETASYEAVRQAVWRSRTAVRRSKAESERRRLEQKAKDSPELQRALQNMDAFMAQLRASRGGA
ncbi:hypothetical protein [Amnibacterium kyonggiense]|nr:hypothetical protein [Amnibacterium kyonggiense]